ncbi:MAG: MFS transporter, partial [Henriciella sp.]
MTSAASEAPQQRSLAETLKLFAQPKMAMMLVLGFTAGLPFLLYFSTLSVWLKESKIDEALIGFFSWFGLAYSFKFVWAPLVDRFDPPGLAKIFGRRRAWIFVAQIGIALALVGLGFSNPTSSLALTALFSFLIAFSSATQDIGIDAWRIEAAANDDEQSTLAAAYQYGYKVGMVISGGVALVIAGVASFAIAYWARAAVMALGAFVFAIWDRKWGIQAAAAAGVILL